MATKATLKSYFETGDTPTQAQLIDVVLNATTLTICIHQKINSYFRFKF